MKPKRIFLSLLTFSLIHCAGMQMEKEWKERGYSDADMKLTEKYREEYKGVIAHGVVSSNAFNSSEKVASEQRIRKIYCSCVKKLGAKCKQPPTGLSAEDREVWAKGNGAEMALRSVATDQNLFHQNGGKVFDEECD